MSGAMPAAARSFRANALSVLAARLVVPALNVALVVLIARRVGVAALGQYTLLVTAFLLCENLKSLGLPNLLTREVARRGVAALELYPSVVRIGLAFAPLGFAATLAVAARGTPGSEAVLLAAALFSIGLVPSAYALANDSVFLAIGRAEYSMMLALFENTLRLVASLAAVWWHGGLPVLAAIYAASRALAALAGHVVLRRALGVPMPAHRRALTTDLLRQAPSFVTVYVLPIVLFRMDVVLLGLLAGDVAVGIYGAAMRIVSLCMVVPDSFMTANFARLSRLVDGHEPVRFDQVVRRTMRWSVLALTPIAIGLGAAAPLLLRVLYGGRFAPAVPVLQILGWMLVPFALARAMGDALVARGHQRAVARVVLATVATSAVLYLIFVPRASYLGAAWAFVLSAVVLLAFQTVQQLRAADRIVTPSRFAVLLAPPLAAFALQRALPALAPGLPVAAVAFLALAPLATLLLPDGPTGARSTEPSARSERRPPVPIPGAHP